MLIDKLLEFILAVVGFLGLTVGSLLLMFGVFYIIGKLGLYLEGKINRK